MDDGALIDQVQCFEYLYDKKHKKFKDKLGRENAWKTIGLILGEEPAACEQRWTVLRAKYTNMKRVLKTIPSGSGLADAPKWKLFRSMSFLDPFLLTRRTTSNYQGDQASCSYNASDSTSPLTSPSHAWDTINEIVIEGDYEAEESVSENAVTMDEEIFRPESNVKNVLSVKNIGIPRNTIPSRKRGPTGTNQEVLATKIGDCIEQFSKRMKSSDESLKPNTGPDYDFAKGLANDMEILTREEKIYFKKQMYDILNNIITSRMN